MPFLEKFYENFIQEYLIDVGIALVMLIVGLILIKWVKKLLTKVLNKSEKVDVTLKPFLISFSITALKVLLIVQVIQTAGATMTSFVAVLGAASLAIGLAFQGALANFAGGVLILILRPFKVGDFIETNGKSGSVEAVQIFNTTLVTPDNKVVIIPNGSISNANITNFSKKSTRRVDLTFGVGYEQDIDKVKSVLEEIVSKHKLILGDPAPFVKLSEHGDSAILFVVRVWANSGDYWTVYFDLLEEVKKRFDEEQISIPYPQMDVHVNQQ